MYLFIYFLIFIMLVFFLRSFMLYRKTGINPITFKKEDDAHGYNGKVFFFVSSLELIVLAVYAFDKNWREHLLPISYLENPVLQKIGWAMLLFSLILVWVAQSHMANSWRIGIDSENQTALVTSGLFKYSRNPIFLGIVLANIGLLFVLPNTFTVLILALSIVSTNTQIRLEEVHLTRLHKTTYIQYKNNVRRWL